MPTVKSGALPVEMLLPISETMGQSCPALATLTFLPHQLWAQPEGKALAGHHPMEPLSRFQPGKSWAPGASTALGSCAAWGLAWAQKP